MARDRLLEEVTGLPHSARFQRLRAAGEESRTNPKIAAVFGAWEKGDWQQRLYCVQSCAGSGEYARLERMLNDRSRTVSGLAMHLLVDHGNDEMLAEVLCKLTNHRRRRLLSRLCTRRRFRAIDHFLDTGFTISIPRIADFLPYGTATAVTRHFAKAEEQGGALFWERLARHHPRIAVSAILEKIANTEHPDGLLLRYSRSVVLYSGRKEPDLTVRLVKALAEFTPLSTLQVREAMRRRPKELTEIALKANDSAPFSLAPAVGKIATALLLRVLRERPDALPLQASWLRKLVPFERTQIFNEVGRSWRDAEGLLPVDVLALLTTNERVQEAERIASLPIMATRPQTQVTYSAYLPWPRMREVVDRFLTHPEGELRACGWGALIASLRFHRDEAATALAMIRKRKFEQDPVRLVILQALTALPQGVWTAVHLDEIAGLIRESLDATDLSHGSAMYLTGFVQKLIPPYPEWAAKQLAIIYSERGNIGGYYLESRINNYQSIILEAAFIDVGERWGKGNRIGWLVWFASALGKRLRVCERLLTTLRGILGKDSGHYAASILQLLREHSTYVDFEELTKQLITAHESWVALPPIFVFLHRHRQDWLEPFLTRNKFHMKGGSKVELITLLQANGYHRYTLTQQTTLANTLNAVIRLPSGEKLPSDVWTMLRAMSFLAILPAIDPSRLIELSNGTRPVISDYAIRALGRLDAGQGLPTLISALDDSRARVAIYALRQSMADMPPDLVLAELRAAPMNKVTVAKETIRLVGEFAGPAGFDWLHSLAKQALHRDVRIAVLRGLWDHLERPEAWAILAESAAETDGQILNGVVRIPADRLSETSRRRLIDLLVGLTNHPDAMIRLAVFRRFIEMPFPDPEGRLILKALVSLSAISPDEREAAAKLVAVNASAKDANPVAETVDVLRERRRPLHDLVQVLNAYAVGNAPGRRRLQPLVRAVIGSLRQDPITAGLRLNLAAAVLGIGEFEQELGVLTASRFSLAAVVNEASIAIDMISQTTDRIELGNLERRLASSDDPALRLLAFVALIAQARDPLRWTDDRRQRLLAYRNDPAPAVAMRAQFYFDDEIGESS